MNKKRRWHYQFMNRFKKLSTKIYSYHDPYYKLKGKKVKNEYLPREKNCWSFRNYEYAKQWAKKHNIKTSRQWTDRKNLPKDLPTNPPTTYRGYGWTNWENFLGTNYVPLYILKEFAKVSGITSQREWRSIYKQGLFPEGVPAAPETVYRKEKWIHNEKYLTFSQARIFARSLNLKGVRDWWDLCRTNKPYNIPWKPNVLYKKDWKGWGDFLGTNRTRRRYALEFPKAKAYARKLNLKSIKEWNEYSKSAKRPNFIPRNPKSVYRDERNWKGLYDFLGIPKKEFWSYTKSKKHIQTLGIKSCKQWWRYVASGKRPKQIPSDPARVYKNKGWKTWGTFFGTNARSPKQIKFKSYEEAKQIVQKLKIKNQHEYQHLRAVGKIPRDLPSEPHKVYS